MWTKAGPLVCGREDTCQHCLLLFADCDRLTVWWKAGAGAAEAILGHSNADRQLSRGGRPCRSNQATSNAGSGHVWVGCEDVKAWGNLWMCGHVIDCEFCECELNFKWPEPAVRFGAWLVVLAQADQLDGRQIHHLTLLHPLLLLLLVSPSRAMTCLGSCRATAQILSPTALPPDTSTCLCTPPLSSRRLTQPPARLSPPPCPGSTGTPGTPGARGTQQGWWEEVGTPVDGETQCPQPTAQLPPRYLAAVQGRKRWLTKITQINLCKSCHDAVWKETEHQWRCSFRHRWHGQPM